MINRTGIIIGARLFVSYHFLKENNISAKTIEKWKERKIGSILIRKKRAFIDYDTIPVPTRSKLPAKAQILAQIDLEDKVEKYETKQKSNFFLYTQITAYFDKAIGLMATHYNSIYNKHFTNPKKIISHGVEHAVCMACVELNGLQPKFKLKDIHRVYSELPYNWVIKNYTRFTGSFKKWQRKDFNLVHSLTGKHSNNANAIKLTDFTKARIEEYYKHPNQYTFDMITKMVHVECKREKVQTVGLSCIKTYLSQPENKNRLSKFRNPQYYNRVVAPIVRRYGITDAGNLYYGDGSPLQIFCWNRDQTEKIRLNLFVVMDVMSGKIVGMDLAESEDRYNVLSAIKMAFDLEKIAPFEYKYDNAAATKTEEYNALKEAMMLKGCTFTPTKKGNPQEKSQVERWFNTFQTKYQRLIDGFIGEGIRSKRDNGRIAPEFLKKCQSRDNLYTYESMCKITIQLIGMYNNDSRGKKASPNEVFAKNAKPMAVKLDTTDIALLFWAHKTIKVTKSEIVTTIRHNDYIFDVFDHSTALRLANKQVKMYYDENDLSNVHLFDLEGKYICECRQKIRVHEGLSGRNEENTLALIKQSKHNEAINGLIKKQTISVKAKGTLNNEIALLNPFDIAKQELNGAETEMYNQFIHQKGHNADKAKKYEPIYTDSENEPAKNKYSEKYKVTNPSLTVIQETD